MAKRLRSPSDDALCAAAAAEVERLHGFFVGWLSGTLGNAREAFSTGAEALWEGFVHIDPDGVVADRDGLLSRLEEAHGRLGDAFQIHIRNCEARVLADDLCLVVYEEWQVRAGGQTGRVSTALLRRELDAPGGFGWLHVHETWLPG